MTNPLRRAGKRRALSVEFHQVRDRRAHQRREVIRGLIKKIHAEPKNHPNEDQDATEVEKDEGQTLQNEGREVDIQTPKKDVVEAEGAEQPEDTARNAGGAKADPSPDAETSREGTRENARWLGRLPMKLYI